MERGNGWKRAGREAYAGAKERDAAIRAPGTHRENRYNQNQSYDDAGRGQKFRPVCVMAVYGIITLKRNTCPSVRTSTTATCAESPVVSRTLPLLRMAKSCASEPPKV